MSVSKVQDTVLIFIIRKQTEVLLYRRINTWYQPNKLALIGGLVDEGESPAEAIIREAQEETSLIIDAKDLVLLTITEEIEPKNGTLYRNHYFLTRQWQGTPTNREPDRCALLQWYDINALPDDTIPIIKTIAQTYVTT